MDMAWEVTSIDVLDVLVKHGEDTSYEEAEEIFEKIDTDAVEDAVLYYTDFEDQSEAALKEIERQLLEKGFITL